MEIEKKFKKLEDREIKIRKEIDDLFTTPVPLPFGNRKKFKKLEDREIKIRKEMDDLFPTPVPLPRPKKSFYQKPKYLYQDPESTHNRHRL